MWRNIIDRIESAPESATRHDLAVLLAMDESGCADYLFRAAYRVKEKNVGRVVYLRGLIEVSNICSCDCLYCGLRAGNDSMKRYCMTRDEIVEAAMWSWRKGYGSVVLQAGERRDARFIDLITDSVKEIRRASLGELAVTLSLGEQDTATYERWFEAGAHRYLMRIETSDEEHYRAIHPAGDDFKARVSCLGALRELGYQVGTGVMIGLPGQTVESLAADVLWFKAMDVDMLGMGPYIPNGRTPLATLGSERGPELRLDAALRMIALCRLVMPGVNIASTTALQALQPDGRELGLLAGANVIMPNVTPLKYRADYEIYPGKPCVGDSPDACAGCLANRVRAAGETIGYNKWGDAPHAGARRREPVAQG